MNKHAFTTILIAIILTIVWAYPVSANTKANINITARGAFLGITCSPASYDFGPVASWAIVDAPQSSLIVTNVSSSGTVYVLVEITTWDSAGVPWVYGPQGSNTGMLAFSADTGTYSNNFTVGVTQNLTDNLAISTSKGFELRLYAPGDFTDEYPNSVNLTLYAFKT